MKRFFSSLFIVGCIMLCFASLPALATGPDLGLGLVDGAAVNAGFDPGTDQTTFAQTLGRAIRIVLSLVGVIFTLLTVYAGFLWMTARGNDTQVEDAKKTLQNAIIGLVIAVASYSITGFVMRAFETGSQAPSVATDPVPEAPTLGAVGDSCTDNADCSTGNCSGGACAAATP